MKRTEREIRQMSEVEFWEEWERITKLLRKAYKKQKDRSYAWKFHHVTSHSGFYGRRY